MDTGRSIWTLTEEFLLATPAIERGAARTLLPPGNVLDGGQTSFALLRLVLVTGTGTGSASRNSGRRCLPSLRLATLLGLLPHGWAQRL